MRWSASSGRASAFRASRSHHLPSLEYFHIWHEGSARADCREAKVPADARFWKTAIYFGSQVAYLASPSLLNGPPLPTGCAARQTLRRRFFARSARCTDHHNDQEPALRLMRTAPCRFFVQACGAPPGSPRFGPNRAVSVCIDPAEIRAARLHVLASAAAPWLQGSSYRAARDHSAPDPHRGKRRRRR